MSRMKDTGAPVLLALDIRAAMLAKVVRGGDSYPPFNVERLVADQDRSRPCRLRITLAVAGFSESELEVLQDGSQLVVRGRQTGPEEVEYLFRGIARRQFQRHFLLPADMEVDRATLRQGLLAIELAVPESAQTVRKINISPSL